MSRREYVIFVHEIRGQEITPKATYRFELTHTEVARLDDVLRACAEGRRWSARFEHGGGELDSPGEPAERG